MEDLKIKLLRVVDEIETCEQMGNYSIDYIERGDKAREEFERGIVEFLRSQRKLRISKVERIIYEGRPIDIDYYTHTIGIERKAYGIKQLFVFLRQHIAGLKAKNVRTGPIIIRIEGRPGAGKSELAKILDKEFAEKALVIEMDDPKIGSRSIPWDEIPLEISRLKKSYNPDNPKYEVVILEGIYTDCIKADITILAKTDEVTLWRRILTRKREHIRGGETSRFLERKDYYEFSFRYKPSSPDKLRESPEVITVDTFVLKEIVLNHLFDCLPVISEDIISAFFEAFECSGATVEEKTVAEKMRQFNI